ncbi:unnamed protein product [Schistosoma margrebowiei]|uniref:Uncharacterized protein n=1 Tax=Schistosoma margrebowiei TaxID=48269 RepID=A0A3P7X629_9TREM|nr:unnamed protein product [Schistosoma margrebowiei]
MGLVSWMYLHLRVDVHSGTRTQYRSLQTPLAVESRTRILSHSGLVSCMHLHLSVDVHSGTRTQYRPPQTLSRYPKHQWEDSNKLYQVNLDFTSLYKLVAINIQQPS